MTWFALYTEPQREQFARERLIANSFTVFYPHIPEWVGLSTHRARLRHRPYFPRYLFIDAHHDDQVSELGGIWLIPGIVGAVKGTDKEPFRIPQEALQPVLDMADVLGCIAIEDLPPLKCGLYRGNRFKVAEGNPLWGLVATVEDVDGEHIVATIGGLFGRVMIAPDQVGEVLAGRDKAGGSPNGRAVSAAA